MTSEIDNLGDGIDHGTYRGAQQHAKANEEACPSCKRARNDYVNGWRRKKLGTVVVYRVGQATGRWTSPIYSPTLTEDQLPLYLDSMDRGWGDSIGDRFMDQIFWIEEATEPKWRPM